MEELVEEAGVDFLVISNVSGGVDWVLITLGRFGHEINVFMHVLNVIDQLTLILGKGFLLKQAVDHLYVAQLWLIL